MKLTIRIIIILLSPTLLWANDLSKMNKARVLFGKGKLNEAIRIYETIPQSSHYWLEAMEEMAHAYGRQKNYAKTLSTLKTVTAPTFAGLIGPEPYFVEALTHLKTCNYSAILETTKNYKTAFNKRRAALEQISTSGTSTALAEVETRLKGQPLTLEILGPQARELPRYLIVDKKLAKNTAQLKNRAQKLAKEEIKEIDQVTNRLHILEAEVIHRVHLADENAKRLTKQGEIDDDSDVLRFPVDQEVWIDELGHYQAEIENCPGSKGT